MNEREPGPAANVVCSSSYAGGSREVSGLFLKSPDLLCRSCRGEPNIYLNKNSRDWFAADWLAGWYKGIACRVPSLWLP